MKTPAGWYPSGEGVSRYWDGTRWTEHTQPEPSQGSSFTPSSNAMSEDSTSGGIRPASRAAAGWFGWGGLIVVTGVGAASSGVSGAGILCGLFITAVALVALVRGRVGWAHLRNRAAGGAAMGAAVALLAIGGATADPQPPAAPQAAPTAPSASARASPAIPPATSSTASGTSSTTAAPVPSTTPPTAAASNPPATSAVTGTALAAAAALPVKGRAAKTGYARDLFGQAWFDTDRNGCDTRNDILRRDLTDKTMSNWCKVSAGTLTPDPYTGATVRFVYGGASEVDIDHVVALSDAWQKGAATWPTGKRLAFANDPLNLLSVGAGANRAKGDGDAATWLPANKSYRCPYVARQVAVKGKYGLWATAAEKAAMTRVLSSCAALALPAAGSAPTTAQLPKTPSTSKPAATTKPAPKPAASPKPAPKSPTSVYYKNCAAARAAGVAPIHVGQPGYSRKLDRDGDGVACER